MCMCVLIFYLNNLISENEHEYLQLRTKVNKVLEFARTEKLIGPSLEAKVYIHTPDASLSNRLHEMCETEIDADSLHHLFITSQVIFTSL